MYVVLNFFFVHEKNKKIIILINDDGGRTRGKGRPRNRKSLFFHHTPFLYYRHFYNTNFLLGI